VHVPAAAATDLAGNPSTGSNTLTRTYDGTAPTVQATVKAGQGDPVTASSVVFVVTANEPVGDLLANKVTVTGSTGAGTVQVARTSDRTFEVRVSGMTSSGPVGVRLAAGALRDPAGNESAQVASPTVAWLSTRLPALEVTLDGSCNPHGAIVGLRLADSDPTTFRLVSSNLGLVPASGMRLTGTGDADRDLQLELEPTSESGVARVTILATSAGGTSGFVVRVMVGTDGADRLRGWVGSNVILGRGGADVAGGRGGDDLLCGGSGNDRLRGGAGNDVLYGEAGDDRLRGGAGKDVLVGGPGVDSLVGGSGNNDLTPRGIRFPVF
jgi:Ca2+-binding RTX toxin-like protein